MKSPFLWSRRQRVAAGACIVLLLIVGFALTPGGTSYLYYRLHRPSSTVKMRGKEANYYADEGRFDQQALLQGKTVAENPTNFSYKLEYAEAMAYAGDTEKARSVYEDIIKNGGPLHRDEVAQAKQAISGNNLAQAAMVGKRKRADFLQKVAQAVAADPRQKEKVKRDGGIKVNYHFAEFTPSELQSMGL